MVPLILGNPQMLQAFVNDVDRTASTSWKATTKGPPTHVEISPRQAPLPLNPFQESPRTLVAVQAQKPLPGTLDFCVS